MMKCKEGSMLTGILSCFMMLVLAGCEEAPHQPSSGKISAMSINKALLQENKDLKEQQDSLIKKYEYLKIKMQEIKDKHQAWIIFQNEVDLIINELAKMGAVIRGKDRISLEEELYFKKGSVNLSKKGESVLSQIAQELRGVDYIIHVEGHTDSVPVRSPRNRQLYKDNWGLSAARAAEVVRYLAGPGRIPQERLAGVFYGEYRPVAENHPKKGNPKNRRVEIRLVPPYVEAGKSINISSVPSPDNSSDILPHVPRGGDSYLGGSEKKEEPVTLGRETDKPEAEEPEGIIPEEDKEEVREPIEKIEDKEEDKEETPVIIR